MMRTSAYVGLLGGLGIFLGTLIGVASGIDIGYAALPAVSVCAGFALAGFIYGSATSNIKTGIVNAASCLFWCSVTVTILVGGLIFFFLAVSNF